MRLEDILGHIGFSPQFDNAGSTPLWDHQMDLLLSGCRLFCVCHLRSAILSLAVA